MLWRKAGVPRGQVMADLTPEESAERIMNGSGNWKFIANCNCPRCIREVFCAAVAHERERCAKLADSYVTDHCDCHAAEIIAAGIRQSSSKPEVSDG